jgi:high affinity Mn2+ porin
MEHIRLPNEKWIDDANLRAEDGLPDHNRRRDFQEYVAAPVGFLLAIILFVWLMSLSAFAQAGSGRVSGAADSATGAKLAFASGDVDTPTPSVDPFATHELSASTAFKEAPVSAEAASPDAVFPHFSNERIWISGQTNFIFQTHPEFNAKYTGANSLVPNYEKATSRVMTLYTGVQLNHSTEVLVHIEEAGGAGLSTALGLAGFSNLDVVRNPTLSSTPYLARVMVHKIFSLSKERTEAERGPLSTFSELPVRRLELRAGKFGTADFFDQNSVGSDSHMQFMNWSTAQNGAYDYAADTRGYTWGALAEYQDRNWALRASESLMPVVANGLTMEWNLTKAHSENVEYDLRRGFLPKREGTVRLLGFVNHANMGVYRDAVAAYVSGQIAKPDITAHPWKTTAKYGFGVNIEQPLTHNTTAYARYGWNDGKTESFAYTEIDSTVSGGVGVNGAQWHRGHDRAGVAFSSNAISRAHQNYLADGGLGFIIGDGALNYGRENIVETYYTAHLWRGVFVAPDLQYVRDPAYNRDRGPVLIPGFRLHVEL